MIHENNKFDVCKPPGGEVNGTFLVNLADCLPDVERRPNDAFLLSIDAKLDRIFSFLSSTYAKLNQLENRMAVLEGNHSSSVSDWKRRAEEARRDWEREHLEMKGPEVG